MIEWKIITAMLTGLAVTLVIAGIGYAVGFYCCLYAYKAGAKMIDRIHHDQVPFDEDLNTEPLDSHTDGMYLDEEEK